MRCLPSSLVRLGYELETKFCAKREQLASIIAEGIQFTFWCHHDTFLSEIESSGSKSGQGSQVKTVQNSLMRTGWNAHFLPVFHPFHRCRVFDLYGVSGSSNNATDCWEELRI